MKILIAIITIGILFNVSIAQNNVIIEPLVSEKISEIVNNPIMVYNLDINKQRDIFKHIDDYFSKYINLDNAKRKPKSGSSNIRFTSETKKNTPIYLKGIPGNQLKIEAPFNIYYVKESFKRSFIKEIRIPTNMTLAIDELIKIANNFIKDNNFCVISEIDKLGKPLVISRKRHLYDSNLNKKEKQTLYQRVEFKREFSGIEVVNSKQIVDIYPESQELIAYKNIEWTPVKESTGSRKLYFSRDEIITQINSAIKSSVDQYKVVNIKRGLYQTEEFLIPILSVLIELKENSDKGFPEEQLLIINLVKDIEFKEKPKTLKRPSKAGNNN